MRQIPTKYLVMAGGFFLAVLAALSFNMKGGIIFSGVASLYIGSVFLCAGINGKAPDFGGYKFRYIALGVVAMIAGIVGIVKYFF